ncbi:hypothetical protein HYQ46_001731 [Verticillium longisporum]|nr:hypothetical protein HYQ46_001731 [Verticillium longisporum]
MGRDEERSNHVELVCVCGGGGSRGIILIVAFLPKRGEFRKIKLFKRAGVVLYRERRKERAVLEDPQTEVSEGHGR